VYFVGKTSSPSAHGGQGCPRSDGIRVIRVIRGKKLIREIHEIHEIREEPQTINNEQLTNQNFQRPIFPSD